MYDGEETSVLLNLDLPFSALQNQCIAIWAVTFVNCKLELMPEE